jgi:hypothetical protein
VDLEGRGITNFDPESPDVPRDRKWLLIGQTQKTKWKSPFSSLYHLLL